MKFSSEDLIKLTGKNLEEYLSNFKELYCIMCSKNLKNKDDKNLGEFKLPCYCNLCSKMCYMNYFNLILKKGKAKSINEFN